MRFKLKTIFDFYNSREKISSVIIFITFSIFQIIFSIIVEIIIEMDVVDRFIIFFFIPFIIYLLTYISLYYFLKTICKNRIVEKIGNIKNLNRQLLIFAGRLEENDSEDKIIKEIKVQLTKLDYFYSLKNEKEELRMILNYVKNL